MLTKDDLKDGAILRNPNPLIAGTDAADAIVKVTPAGIVFDSPAGLGSTDPDEDIEAILEFLNDQGVFVVTPAVV
jgi:hypothetical protein